MTNILKTIFHPAKNRGVLILWRGDQLFTYEEEKLERIYNDEMAARLKDCRTMWVPVGGKGLTLCESQEAAEREAHGAGGVACRHLPGV